MANRLKREGMGKMLTGKCEMAGYQLERVKEECGKNGGWMSQRLGKWGE